MVVYVDVRADPNAVTTKHLEDLVDRALQSLDAGPTEDPDEPASSQDDEAPRLPGAAGQKRKAASQAASDAKRVKIQQFSNEDWEHPLAGMKPGLRAHAPWYKASSVQPFTFNWVFTSQRIVSRLQEAELSDLGLPALYAPWSTGFEEWPPAIAFDLPSVTELEFQILFNPMRLEDRPDSSLPPPKGGPWYRQDPHPDLKALLDYVKSRKAPMGTQGLWLSSQLSVQPDTSGPDQICLSLVLTPYISSSFLGLAPLPENARDITNSIRGPALTVVFPRPKRARLEELAQRGAEHRFDGQITSEWFYNIIDSAPSHDSIAADPKGKGKQRADPGLIKPKGLKATLMPFQSRSVAWLLSREGVQVDWDSLAPGSAASSSAGHSTKPLSETQHRENITLPYWDHVRFEGELVDQKDPYQGMDLSNYKGKGKAKDSDVEAEEGQQRQVKDATETPVWNNYLTGLTTRHRPLANDQGGGFGVLCEEMGLGKTVEILSLILMNPEPGRSALLAYYDSDIDVRVQPSGVTLIICPLAILRQWKTEVEKHAPQLRVLVYEGINNKKFQKSKLDAKKIADQFDIMLCSFEVLGREVVYARRPPERNLRGERKYERRRSILVEIDFLRVCMDEVQMAAAPASGISETAALVRRKHSFAVSGTPIRGRLSDLTGLFKFLGFGLGDDQRGFENLLTVQNADIFADVISKIAIRTVKAKVEHELVLPGQDRYIVPLEFEPIEQASYRNRYSDALVDLGLNRDGTAPSADWEPDRQTMASWIVRLRQLCCHMYTGPQTVGGGARRETRKGPRTLDQVLEDMRSDVDTALWSSVRTRFDRNIKKAHFVARDKENCEGLEEGIAILKVCIGELVPEIENTREVLGNIRRDLKDLSSRRYSGSDDDESDTESSIESSDDDSDQRPSSNSARKTLKRTRLVALRQHLRSLLILLHVAQFWLGSCYFGIGNQPDEENKAYEDAEIVRKEILKRERKRAEMAIKSLKAKTSPAQATVQQATLELNHSTIDRGIQSALVLDRVADTANKLNSIAELLWEWRGNLIDMMSGILTADEADEEDYAKRAEQEEKVDIMLDIYRQLLADYHESLTGERGINADDSSSQVVASIQLALREIATQGLIEGPRKTAKNKRKKGAAASSLATDMEKLRDYGLGPGAIFYKELSDKRHEIIDTEVSPLRTLCRDMHDLLESNIRREEVTILEGEWTRLRQALGDLDRAYEKANNELTSTLQPTFRARNLFYKSLQALSDTVVDVEIKKTSSFLNEIAIIDEDEGQLDQEIRTALSRQRYLDFLGADLAGMPDSERMCTICGDVFNKGIFTACGHLFCSECLRSWLARSATCPTCKTPLRHDSYQTVVFHGQATKKSKTDLEKQTMAVQAIKAAFGKDDEALSRSTPLRKLDQAGLSRIEEIPTRTGLGKKLDTVVKHVRFLQNEDPGCKIVLSAWQQSLDSCSMALSWYGIKAVRLERNSKMKGEAATSFANDPEVSVFLLHTHSQAAGLNLTAARYVILFEPLVHPGVELQAVGRVHRIGQRKTTRVFQYTIVNTVDERLAQFNADNGHRLFALPEGAGSDDEDMDLSQSMEAIAGTAPPPIAAQKNSEEVLTTSDEDMARILFEDQELRTLQTCLLERAGGGDGGDADEEANVEMGP